MQMVTRKRDAHPSIALVKPVESLALRAVGNDHFSDPTLPKDYPPPYREGIPLYRRIGKKPLIPQPCWLWLGFFPALPRPCGASARPATPTSTPRARILWVSRTCGAWRRRGWTKAASSGSAQKPGPAALEVNICFLLFSGLSKGLLGGFPLTDPGSPSSALSHP